MNKQENNDIFFNEFNVEIRKLMHYAMCYSNIIELALSKDLGNKDDLKDAKTSIDGVIQGINLIHGALTLETTMKEHHNSFKDLITHALKKIDLNDNEVKDNLDKIYKAFESGEKDLSIERGHFTYE